MIEKKYQFYIDRSPQEEFCNKKIFVKPFNLTEAHMYNGLKIDEYMAQITEYTVNTKNNLFKNFCLDNNISENLYNKVVNNFREVCLVYYDIVHINDLDPITEYCSYKSFYKTYFETKKEHNIPFIIKFEKKEYVFLDYLVNYNKNLIISRNILDNTIQAQFRYRILLNDRLLIERFYPEDLPQSKIICEECFLDLLGPTNVRLETTNDLLITKIVSNNNAVYPNSKEFIIEP